MSVPVRHGSPVTGRSFLTVGAKGLGSNEEFEEHLDVLVKTDTLDHFVEEQGIERLDFVKADVEGAELRVLEGGKATIERLQAGVPAGDRGAARRAVRVPREGRRGLPRRARVRDEHVARRVSGCRRDNIGDEVRNYLFRA